MFWEVMFGVYFGGLLVVGTMIGLEELVNKYREYKRNKTWAQSP